MRSKVIALLLCVAVAVALIAVLVNLPPPVCHKCQGPIYSDAYRGGHALGRAGMTKTPVRESWIVDPRFLEGYADGTKEREDTP